MVKKTMGNNPRRIAKIEIDISLKIILFGIVMKMKMNFSWFLKEHF